MGPTSHVDMSAVVDGCGAGARPITFRGVRGSGCAPFSVGRAPAQEGVRGGSLLFLGLFLWFLGVFCAVWGVGVLVLLNWGDVLPWFWGCGGRGGLGLFDFGQSERELVAEATGDALAGGEGGEALALFYFADVLL